MLPHFYYAHKANIQPHQNKVKRQCFKPINGFICLALMLLILPIRTWAANLVDYPHNKPQSLTAFHTPIRVINIWATWCAPCRKEMPAMSAWYQKKNKQQIRLIGIALDREDNIAKFLQTTPVRYPIWRYTGKDSRVFMQSLGNTIGALPYTLVEAKGCQFKHSITGEVNAQKLDDAIKLVQQQCKK